MIGPKSSVLFSASGWGHFGLHLLSGQVLIVGQAEADTSDDFRWGRHGKHSQPQASGRVMDRAMTYPNSRASNSGPSDTTGLLLVHRFSTLANGIPRYPSAIPPGSDTPVRRAPRVAWSSWQLCWATMVARLGVDVEMAMRMGR